MLLLLNFKDDYKRKLTEKDYNLTCIDNNTHVFIHICV